MFDDFFMIIGEVYISIFHGIKNFKFEHDDVKKNDSASFDDSKLSASNNDEGTVYFSALRQIFLRYFMLKQVLFFIFVVFFILFFIFGLELSLMFIVLIGMIYVLMLYYPKIKQRRMYADLNFELPYALRHMGIELKSGKGLHDTLVTVANANYGSFSLELKRVLEEVRYGQSTENSLLEMSDRVNSNGLSRCIQQIIGTLRVGGNLANNLEIIADDISFDMRVKLKEYAQKLNGFILIYTFIAILAPVILLIMLMAASTVMGDILSLSLLMVLYGVFFPSIVIFMGVFIKRLEPDI